MMTVLEISAAAQRWSTETSASGRATTHSNERHVSMQPVRVRPSLSRFGRSARHRAEIQRCRVIDDPAALSQAAQAIEQTVHSPLVQEGLQRAAEAVDTVTKSAEMADAGAMDAAVEAVSTSVSTSMDVASEAFDAALVEGAEAYAVTSAEAVLTAEAASAVGGAVGSTVGVADAVTKFSISAAGVGGIMKFLQVTKLSRDLWSTYSGLLFLHPLITKSFTGSFLYTLSDTVTQGAVEEKAVEDIDAERLRRFAIWGMLDAVMTHNWYKILDEATTFFFGADPPAGDWHHIAFEVTADQLVYAPVWFVAFFTYSGIYEGDSWDKIAKRIQTEMIPAVTTSWVIWIPLMTFSFTYVPQDLRVPYYLIASFAYAMLLSSVYGEVDVHASATSSASDSKAAASAGGGGATSGGVEFELGAFLDSLNPASSSATSAVKQKGNSSTTGALGFMESLNPMEQRRKEKGKGSSRGRSKSRENRRKATTK